MIKEVKIEELVKTKLQTGEINVPKRNYDNYGLLLKEDFKI